MKQEYCPRCGKLKHDKKCTFDREKVSIVEESASKMEAVIADVKSIKDANVLIDK